MLAKNRHHLNPSGMVTDDIIKLRGENPVFAEKPILTVALIYRPKVSAVSRVLCSLGCSCFFAGSSVPPQSNIM